jgi:hypothetical protein
MQLANPRFGAAHTLCTSAGLTVADRLPGRATGCRSCLVTTDDVAREDACAAAVGSTTANSVAGAIASEAHLSKRSFTGFLSPRVASWPDGFRCLP